MATGYQDNILATVTANVLLPKVMLEFCNCEKPKGRKDVLTTLEREKAPFRPIIRDNDSGMNASLSEPRVGELQLSQWFRHWLFLSFSKKYCKEQD